MGDTSPDPPRDRAVSGNHSLSGARRALPSTERSSHTPSSRGLTGLWALTLVIIALLSVWPFEFQPRLATARAWGAFIDSFGWWTSLGDAAANVLLFTPTGFLAGLTVVPMPVRRGIAIFTVLTVSSLSLATAFQAAQITLPSRDATLVDTVWNTAGFTAGALTSLSLARLYRMRSGSLRSLRPIPIGLVALWLGYRLAPFVPARDIETITGNLAPLLRAEFAVASFAAQTAAWTAVAFLLRDASPSRTWDRWLPVMMMGVFTWEALVIQRDGVSLADVSAAALALVTWFGGLHKIDRPAPWVLLGLLAGIVCVSLWPFQFTDQALQPFYWRPFIGILYGDMWSNTLSVLWKSFAYGALVYLAWRVTQSWVTATAGAMIATGAVEWLQRFQQSHVPEITDPLLTLLAGIVASVLAGKKPD